MSRVLFALVVAISVVSCSKGGQEADQVAANASGAGKVLEVTGKVTVRGKPLVVGQVLAADDVVETAEDGHVVIELSHNLAHWELGANKSQKVNESIAWKLPKNEGNSQFTITDMSAAGRPAEKSAANAESSAPAAQPAPAQAATPPAATTSPTAPPPPPPPPKAAASKSAALKADVGAIDSVGGIGRGAGATGGGAGAPGGGAKGGGLAGIGGGASAGGGTGASAGGTTGDVAVAHATRAPKALKADDLVERQEPALKACLAPGAVVKIHVVVDANGKAVTTVDDADAKTKACLVGVIGKLQFPSEKASVSMTIEKSNR